MTMGPGMRCQRITLTIILIFITVSFYSFSSEIRGRIIQFRNNSPSYPSYITFTNSVFDVKSSEFSSATPKAEIDYRKRFLDYAKQDILHMSPPTYLPELKNPCWYEYDTLTNERRLRCLPYFMIIGQNKCGTSDLYPSILTHPDVVSAREKEPQFWARHRHCYCCGSLTYSFRCKKGKPWTWTKYVDFYKATAKIIKRLSESEDQSEKLKSNQIITGEASPSNLWDNRWWWNYEVNRNDTEPPALTNADYLRHFLPNLKMIIILRNPVTRLYSDYLYTSLGKVSPTLFHAEVVKEINWFKNCSKYHDIRYCVYRNSFNEANVKSVTRVQNGLYALYIADYMRLFPPEQFHVLRLEDYGRDKAIEMKKIFQFLNLGDVEVQYSNTRKNKGKRTKKAMLPETKALLKEFYQPYNIHLAELLKERKYLWLD